MDYFKILKKAFILPWKYRFLFWLGVIASFAAGGGGGWSGFNYSGSSTDWQKMFDENKQSSFLHKLQGSVPRMSRVLGASTDRFSDFISHNIYWIALVILILMLI